jgi:MarR family transcriptional regulator, organic hydroperoxide resistance regulator
MTHNRYVVLGRLMANIGRLHSTKANHFMDQIGLYRGQAILMMTLSEQDGLTHSYIAEKLQISPAAVTKVIKRLEEENFIQRRPDERDERVSRVYLREKGRAAIDEIHRSFCALDNKMFEGLSEEELDELHKVLLHVLANLHQCRPSL